MYYNYCSFACFVFLLDILIPSFKNLFSLKSNIVERRITSSILFSLSFFFILYISWIDYLDELFAFYVNDGFMFFKSNIFLLKF